MLQTTTITPNALFDQIDPVKNKFNTLGDVISNLLNYVYPLAGLILFGMLLMGGFDLLTSAGNPEKVKAGQGKITSALIGFLIIFLSYWIIQILQIILGMGSIF
jgi:hypothetical protein